jgi:N-methylhydantoinase A
MKRLAIDVGGTFTDCVVLMETGELRTFKAPTTPKNPEVGVLDSLQKAAASFGRPLKDFLGDVEVLIHGTTLATNALLTGQGAKTGMITTRNFRDIVEIKRGIKDVRTSMYDIFVDPYKPLVPRELRLGVSERTLSSGDVETALVDEDVRKAVEKFGAQGVKAVCICFLHSYANPANERRAVELVNAHGNGIYVSASHEILPVWGEYERFSSTMIDAYVGPVVSSYLTSLESRLKQAGFRGTHLLIILANGLMQSVEHCRRRASYLIGSGPAAAPSAGVYLGSLDDKKDLMTIDMGGTSFDVCLIQGGNIPTTTERWEGEHRLAVKSVDVHSVGAGGGSIASIDALGLLRVGPRSAGAEPGPCCYGRGGVEPTVTDADVVLGYVPADYFLGGEVKLDERLAREAVMKVGAPLKMDAAQAAQAIFATVNATMADAISEVSTKKGYDVRDFTLVAGGGAGAVHAGFIAELLNIPTVIIPQTSALLSAFGMLTMDIGRDFARSYVGRSDRIDLERVNQIYEAMEAEALEMFRSMDIAQSSVVMSRTADMRYVRQFHEVEVEMPRVRLAAADMPVLLDAFHREHEEIFTFSMPWREVEYLTFRLKASAPRSELHLERARVGGADASGALKRSRRCWFDGRPLDTPVYDGDKLAAGNRIAGPAIIEERTTTAVVPPGFTAEIDAFRNCILCRQ